MLQLLKAARAAQDALKRQIPFPPSWKNVKELEDVTDDWMRRWLLKRTEMAKSQGLFTNLLDCMDRAARTHLPEHTDNPLVSPDRKVRIVRSLHRMNIIMGAYKRYGDILTPVLMDMARKRKRPVRLLELACGSGDNAMSLARLRAKKNLPLEITGSDYVEDVVQNAAAKAARMELDLRFRIINALDMSQLDQDEYDIFLITGTMHHFTPGQLAVIFSQLSRFKDSVFIGIDGFRSMTMLLGLPLLHIITFLPDHIHDAWFTARKFYTLPELEYIAQIAVPDAEIIPQHDFPGISVLKLYF
jgi:2-polyprenyl-3-methyl-5-hydroxy-6-metoxy-1,4-benzoquinol methylase